MKHIIKVNNILEAIDNPIRPIVALDNNSVLFVEGAKAIPAGFVDLGLASGTLWSTSLLGATNGDTVESWYGNYYAWGEIVTKTFYNWEDSNDSTLNYKYANGTAYTLTKYCTLSDYGNNGFTDNLTQLLPEDDAAAATNSAWRMPTQAELEELIALPSEWITDYNGISGLNGRVFTGNNGNTLFIPAAGQRYDANIYSNGSYCYVWSSSLTLEYSCGAYYLYSSSGKINMRDKDRVNGMCICPVC